MDLLTNVLSADWERSWRPDGRLHLTKSVGDFRIIAEPGDIDSPVTVEVDATESDGSQLLVSVALTLEGAMHLTTAINEALLADAVVYRLANGGT